ncbi:hypothetical protein SCLARK_00434 [Spiroplasma clarkii]|uniref:Uncharacterized protein n=1 Tax=Spiroplasma clarkii TaxID=2139 RepID=A0A1Y0KZJ0_9MOLU|nr:hypothetical protein [Spiroplasma clarkii]ARU91156.1 hypothetical protein SCLARK_00434 [Spiroplasma clarkii]ATX70594.1 hypothetical protein SCLAR_v1c02640 [Spiroplasma clarkii]
MPYNLNVFFINNPVGIEGKNFYRLYLFFEYGHQNHYEFPYDFYIKGKGYLSSNGQNYELTPDEKNNFVNNSGENNYYSTPVWAFYLIPAEKISNDQFDFLISVTVKIKEKTKTTNNDSSVRIHVDTTPKYVRVDNTILDYGLVSNYAIVFNEKLNKMIDNFHYLSGLFIRYEIIQKPGFLDFDLKLNYWFYQPYIWDWNKVFKQIQDILRQIKMGIIIPVVVSESSHIVKNEQNYQIKKLETKEAGDKNFRYYQSANKTTFDWKTGKVIETVNGSEGITLNPTDLSETSFVREIEINQIKFVLEQSSRHIIKDYTITATSELNFTNYVGYQVNYLVSEWNKLAKDKTSEVIKFINGKEKELN